MWQCPDPFQVRSGSERNTGGETSACHAAIPLGEHAAGEAEIPAQVSLLWPQDFTAKPFSNLQFWLERLPKLIEPQP